MGRKSSSKQNTKKNSSKEGSKYEQQKRKELAVLVDKLLKLTSIFQATVTPAKSWEHYLEIESLLKQIQNIEAPKTKSETPSRESNIEEFLKWLNENEAQYEGVEIASFKGYDLGLKATKDFKEGSLMLTIPRKVMMSEQDARESILGKFIEVDPLLQNMPNITLALFLLMEKSKPDSFWAPYIAVLPERYSTILYFTPDELAELKPSPVLESSLKLYRSIARQYAYFYMKIHTLDLPVVKNLQDIFTFENYRWAVSTVMTRQNNISLSHADTTAFIPLWDMCNHQHGKITTDFNKELSRGECFALRDFAAGEQLFIFYGARPNSDLFLHNGFVYPDNQYDSLSLCLGISSEDPRRAARRALLSRLGLGGAAHYPLYAAAAPVSAELRAFVRIFCMDEDDVTKWSSHNVPSELVSSEPSSAEAVGAALDRKAYNYLMTRCKLLKTLYVRSATEDKELSLHRNNVKLLKECEVRILDGAIEYLQGVIDSLPVEETK
ncbi:actin-histidine N-methyltransferase [Plutella xylostella]|uniref:actin-histidine N-methyltransferase n=1 Tax=Plutella xylostella TaxID=51655 RepID=UPI00203258F8|nr:actin-histidine N-methyltransferase [Plutella xylostella]